MNVIDGPVQMRTGLLMNRDELRSLGHKVSQVIIRILDHQVHIIRGHVQLVQALHDHCTIGNVRNEMSIHHIYMKVIRSGFAYKQ